MHTSTYIYHHGEQELHGFLAYSKQGEEPKPAVIVVHDWSGRNDFACQKAEELANLGFIGFAVDMFGKGQLGTTTEEKQALMQPLVADRTLLRARIRAAFDTVVAMPEVDSSRIAAIGFCFGGLCVLDLARSGTEVTGVVSFHGLLDKPHDVHAHRILSKILVLHGYDDPMGKPNQVASFCQEMTDAKADWQVHLYGHTQHAFTNPKADDPHLGTIYNAKADQRSWIAMQNFLQDIFHISP